MARSSARKWLAITDSDGPVAAVEHDAPALDDAPTVAAVSNAVRLAVTHARLQEEQRLRLLELEASRARIVAAANRQRERAAGELRKDVDAPLRVAQSELRAARRSVRDSEAAAALDVVIQELEAATGEIADLVAGIPPADLGDGRLRQALDALAQASPVPVSVAVADDAEGDQETETTLVYACCQALTNAAKHANAGAVAVSLHGTVRKPDCTDAADRVGALGGHLTGGHVTADGTTVTAVIPCAL
jgi:signal transduction histidine kinase